MADIVYTGVRNKIANVVLSPNGLANIGNEKENKGVLLPVKSPQTKNSSKEKSFLDLIL